MSRKGKQEITQADVSSALAQFLNQGGVIKQLPAQEFRVAGTVGADKYEAYETLNDLPALADQSEPLN